MKRSRKIVLVGAAIVAAAAAGIFAAERLGVDTLLVAERIFNSIASQEAVADRKREPSSEAQADEPVFVENDHEKKAPSHEVAAEPPARPEHGSTPDPEMAAPAAGHEEPASFFTGLLVMLGLDGKDDAEPAEIPLSTAQDHAAPPATGHEGEQKQAEEAGHPAPEEDDGQSILGYLAGLVGVGMGDADPSGSAHDAEPDSEPGKEPGDAHARKAPDPHGADAKEPAHEPAREAHGSEPVHGEPAVDRFVFDPAAYMLPPGKNQPWRLLRELQHAQDYVVGGVPNALEGYRRQAAAASDKMLALPPETWTHERNILATAAYIMGGGRVDIAKRILSGDVPSDRAHDLLRGALAYAQGDYYDAYRLFYPVDPESLPISLGGQVALVKAMLISPRDLNRAMGFLDLARRLAPRTLVEEAALRRQIRVLAETGDGERFFAVAGAYVRRFPDSAFLSDFLRNYAYGALKLAQGDEQRAIEEIRDLQNRLSPKARLYLLSIVARGATVFGEFKLAREAVETASQLGQDDPRLMKRLKLYRAAASLTDRDTLETATRELEEMTSDALGGEDARLLDAARLVSERIHGSVQDENLPPPDESLPSPDATEERSDDDLTVGSIRRPVDNSADMPSIISRSDAMLRQAEQVLDW